MRRAREGAHVEADFGEDAGNRQAENRPCAAIISCSPTKLEAVPSSSTKTAGRMALVAIRRKLREGRQDFFRALAGFCDLPQTVCGGLAGGRDMEIGEGARHGRF